MKQLYIFLALLVAATVAEAQSFTITPRQLNFQNVVVGKTREMTVQLSVGSGGTKDVSVSVTPPSTAHYVYSSGVTFFVGPGNTHFLTVQFTPLASGAIVDSIILSHDGDTTTAKNPTVIRLTGTGVAVDTHPKITITQLNNNLGNVTLGTTATRTVKIKNTSDTLVTLTGTISAATLPFKIESGGAPFSLAMDDSVMMTVSFTPTDTGLYRDTLIVKSNARDTIITFTARAVPIDTFAKVTITPGFVNLGTVAIGQKATRTFTVRNSSDVAKTLSGTVEGLNGAFKFTAGNAPFTLAKGDSVVVTVEFAPTLSGFQRDTVVILTNSSDPANQMRQLILFGTGTGDDGFPKIQVTPQFLAVPFGNVAVGTPSKQNVTITNVSEAARKLIVSVGQTTGPLFMVTSGGGTFSLDSGASKIVELTFTPTSAGVQRDTFFITSNANEVNKNIRVTMSGTGVASGVENVTSPTGFMLVPNPTSSKVSVRFRQERVGTVSANIFDVTGKEVMNIAPRIYGVGENAFDFDCSMLASGEYFVRISTPDHVKTIKLIKE